MKSKWTLIAGIVLLTIGIIIRKTTGLTTAGLIMILTGVSFKVFYIVSKARSGEYVPGKELLALFAGLGLFLGGLFLKSSIEIHYTSAMMISGITLKVLFIILFILKTRTSKTVNYEVLKEKSSNDELL